MPSETAIMNIHLPFKMGSILEKAMVTWIRSMMIIKSRGTVMNPRNISMMIMATLMRKMLPRPIPYMVNLLPYLILAK